MARGGAQKKGESVVVAIDKDKFSQQALKWTIERILTKGQALTLLHVKQKPSSSAANSSTNLSANSDYDEAVTSKQQLKNHARDQFFLPFRRVCKRSNIPCNEVMLEEGEISKTLINYVNKNVIDILVLGAPSRVYKTFKLDIPSSVSKEAPHFCTVYVIGNKGKVSSVRQSSIPAPAKPITPPYSQLQTASPRPQLLHQLNNASEVAEQSNQLRSQPSRYLETQGMMITPAARAVEDFEIKMDKKCLFIRYGGTWHENEKCYTGGCLKGIVVPSTLKYNELKNRIYEITKVSLSNFDIVMRVKYKLAYESPPLYIMDDDDVQFLLVQEDLSKVQLFITIEENIVKEENEIREEEKRAIEEREREVREESERRETGVGV